MGCQKIHDILLGKRPVPPEHLNQFPSNAGGYTDPFHTAVHQIALTHPVVGDILQFQQMIHGPAYGFIFHDLGFPVKTAFQTFFKKLPCSSGIFIDGKIQLLCPVLKGHFLFRIQGFQFGLQPLRELLRGGKFPQHEICRPFHRQHISVCLEQQKLRIVGVNASQQHIFLLLSHGLIHLQRGSQGSTHEKSEFQAAFLRSGLDPLPLRITAICGNHADRLGYGDPAESDHILRHPEQPRKRSRDRKEFLRPESSCIRKYLCFNGFSVKVGIGDHIPRKIQAC